jgi:hypothetical protein
LSADGIKKLEDLAALEGLSVKQMLNSYLHQKD